MKQIPNLFTLLNLVFGCLAIIFTLQNGIITTASAATGVELIDIPEKIWFASLFIGLAAVVDFLDGFVARLFKATSDMGKQLDSLADLVSFGVAPGLIMYQFLRLTIAQEEGALDTSMVSLLPALLIPVAAAWRLARFNLDAGQAYSFKGLPVPAVGLFVAALPLIYWNINEDWVLDVLLNQWVLYGIILLLSGLMVSTIPILSLKFEDFSVRNNIPKIILAVIAVGSFLMLSWTAIPLVIISYVILSFIFKSKKVA
ncbi:MAG: CDP-alcohol phosphatidyltransferase family protein [Chitinophagaceae bacterium]|nr:CDP-alcohol phosphatidyltransferase family protein [Chitinophagaceae bacterium]